MSISQINDGKGYSFPDPTVSDKKKDKEYHHKAVLAIANNSFDNGFTFTHGAIQECYNFYDGIQDSDSFDFLQSAEDGDVLPAEWMNFNTIKKRVDLILGEFMRKSYVIDAFAINRDAKVRKLEEKERVRVEMRLRGLSQELEDRFGMRMMDTSNLPADEQELEETFQNYKDTAEHIMTAAIKWLCKVNDWSYERYALFRDVLIAGRCFIKTEIVNGRPTSRRVDPRFMIFDSYATNDFLSDSTYFGEVRYMPISQIAQIFNLSKIEIKEIYNTYNDIVGPRS